MIWNQLLGPKYPLVFTVNGRWMPKSSLAILKFISLVGIGKPPNLIPRMAVQSRGRIMYSPQFKWKVPVSAWNCCTKALPILCLMMYRGIRRKSLNPYSLRNSTYRWWVSRANTNRRKVYQTPWPWILSAPYIQNQKLFVSTFISQESEWQRKKYIIPIPSAEGWSFSPCWRWVSLMPLSTAPMWASAPAWLDGNLGLNEKILSSHHSSRGPSPCSWPTPWGSPTRNSIGLKGDIGCLDWTLPHRTSLHGYTTGRPGSSPPPAVKVTLQNLSRLLASRNDLIIKRVVPMGCSVNRGFLLISPRTSPPRQDLQNNKKFRHKW